MVDIPKHKFIMDLLSNPDAEPLVALAGYAGPSNDSRNIRLYADLTFKTYLEVPADAVTKTMLAKADDENSPNVVMVDAKTQVTRVTTERTTGDAAFLSGAISNAHYGAAQAMGGAGGAHAGCICLTFSIVNTIGPGAANAAGAGISGFGCTTVTAPTHQYYCPPAAGSALGCTTVTAPPITIGCPQAGQGAMAGGTIHTMFNCQHTMVVNCTITAGPNCAQVQGGAAAPCHNITHTLATTCTMPVPGGGGGWPCQHITLTAATLCTQAAAAQPNVGALACLNVTATTVCTPTGVPFLCPAG